MHEYMRNEIYELLLVWNLRGRAVFSALYVRALFLLGGGGWKVIRPEIYRTVVVNIFYVMKKFGFICTK